MIEVDGFGVVRAAHGGFGGFLGLDVPSLVGESVFDHMVPADAAELAQYFIESAGESFDTVSLPLPFRVELIGGDGRVHPVDVVATGRDEGEDTWSWVAVLVPTSLQASMSRPLDAIMEREPRVRVKTLLTEEFSVENQGYSSRGFMVEPVDPSGVAVVAARVDDQDLSDEIARSIAHGWAPWEGIAHAETESIAVEALPAGVRALVERRGWRRISVTPVHLDDAVVAAYLVMGRVPADYEVGRVRSNVASRYRYLARATALILGAWRDRDRLEHAATHDALTGLANRRAFDSALAAASDGGVPGGLLFVDVDDFKSVNDRFGHAVGDEVLVEIGRRIASVCGPGDLAARIGGDEFAVLVRSRRDLDRLADEIVARVGAPLPARDGPEVIGVTVGAVHDLRDGDTMAEASRAMREQKHRAVDRGPVAPC